MCLIAFAWGASERFPFVVAANRDEFFERPTAPLDQWTSPAGVSLVSGRDLRDGGTWMGFTAQGRFAMLTNVRNPSAPPAAAPISRGRLVLDWLESDLSAMQWAQGLEPQRYQGFNLVIGDGARQHCYYMTNQGSLMEPGLGLSQLDSGLHLRHLPTGAIYGLSNAALDTPWPKTRLLKHSLQDSLSKAISTEQLSSQCLSALQDTDQAIEAELPRTGVPQDLEKALSSIFVRYPQTEPAHYGTRSSLVAAYEAHQGLLVTEVTHEPDRANQAIARMKLDWRLPMQEKRPTG